MNSRITMSQAFRDLLARDTPEKRIISIGEVVDQLDGPALGSITQYSRNPGNGGPWFGSASPHQTTRSIYLTKVQIADGEEQLAYCMNDFMETMTEEQYKEHTFTFTQAQWDESPRTPPPVEEDNAEVNAVADAVADANEEADAVADANEEADAVGNPEEKTFEEEAANLLNRRKNIILEGPPGTGKTYAMKGIVNALKEDGVSIGKEGKDDFAITMHPATSYEDFIEGLRPGNVAGEFDYSAGVFVEKVKHAIRNPLEQHVVLLDELNRCNVPRVLGDLLTTIESSKRTDLMFKNEIINEVKVKSTFDFIVASLKDVGDASDNGLRFSVTPMNNQNHDDGFPRFYVNPEDKKISKEKGTGGNFRALKVNDFKGDYGAMATFEPNLQIRDDKKEMKKAVVLIFIKKIGYPVLGSEWIKTILQDVDEKPDEVEIELLGGSGGMKFTSSNVTDLSFDTDGFIRSGKIDLIAKLNGPCDDCPPNTDYYWCENCDGNWDKTDRTEIALPGSKRRFHVPNNLLVVGTMNTTDRSVAPLDAALRRRFVFLRVDRSKLSQKELRKLSEGERRTLLKDAQTLWEKLNDQLEGILGKDATIGHSYLYELRTELKNEADPEKLENLVVEFWRYSVLPQVADLLDATGKASDIWDSIGLEPQFNALGLKMNTGKKKYRTFSRTIVELTEED